MRCTLVPLLAAVSACTTVAAAPREGDTAALGETVRIVDLVVTPRAVVEDSRCPVDVTCIWAGRIVLRAQVNDGASRRVFDLDLGQSVQVGDGMLALREVTPARHSGAPISPADYRFHFTFDGLE
ncbi:MAG: hypothetical protein ACT4N8_10780 [Sphingosinicella sp.]|uniref:hypothetical protein n=1 Tax=Sphingosinicella sp. TaxID=1917971 RepID=UPI0040377639